MSRLAVTYWLEQCIVDTVWYFSDETILPAVSGPGLSGAPEMRLRTRVCNQTPVASHVWAGRCLAAVLMVCCSAYMQCLYAIASWTSDSAGPQT